MVQNKGYPGAWFISSGRYMSYRYKIQAQGTGTIYSLHNILLDSYRALFSSSSYTAFVRSEQ